MVSNAHEAKRNLPILASGVQLHVLPAGARFDMTTRTLIPDEAQVIEDEVDELGPVAELAAAGRDLRKLARDIAAGDVSPTVLRRRRARRTRGAAHE
jgi:cyanophycinase